MNIDRIKTSICMIGHLLEHHPATGNYAFDKYGGYADPTEPSASCWCLLGARHAVKSALRLTDSEWYEQTKVMVNILGDIHLWMSGKAQGRLMKPVLLLPVNFKDVYEL